MQWLSDFAALIYPKVCIACEETLLRHEEPICNKCYVSLPKTNFHLDANNPVQKVFYGRVDVKLATSFLLFQKKGSVQKMLHALKYKHKPELGHLLGKWYGADLKKSNTFAHCDYIIAVPLHNKRLRKRGYNQSECFARGLSEELNIPVLNNVLFKKHFTETQTYKTREERLQSAMHSFEIKNAEALKDKSILLADDVITTGATAEACLLQLQQATKAPVYAVSIAYTL